MKLINKILVPIDFSDYSKKALEYARDFAKQFGAKIYIVYVIEPVIYPADFSMGQIPPAYIDSNFQQTAEKELNQLLKSDIFTGIETEAIMRSGKPFMEINEVAKEKDADLIIIATHGHTGIDHVLFGSTAEKVVRKAPCPVLTLREPIKGFQFNC